MVTYDVIFLPKRAKFFGGKNRFPPPRNANTKEDVFKQALEIQTPWVLAFKNFDKSIKISVICQGTFINQYNQVLFAFMRHAQLLLV